MQRFTRAFGYFSLGFAISLLINYWLRQQEEARKQPMARGFASPPPRVPPVPPVPPPSQTVQRVPAAPAKPVSRAKPAKSDDLTVFSRHV